MREIGPVVRVDFVARAPHVDRVDRKDRFLGHRERVYHNVLAFAANGPPHLILLLAGFTAQHALLMHAFPEGLLGNGEWGLLAIG